jgi:hypothetical protein
LYNPKPIPDRYPEMTEDSGAFKTNPANSRRVPAFVMLPQCPLQRSLTVQETRSGLPGEAFTPPF